MWKQFNLNKIISGTIPSGLSSLLIRIPKGEDREKGQEKISKLYSKLQQPPKNPRLIQAHAGQISKNQI